MPPSSEPDWCTQVRYASMINAGNVTDDCFSSLSARCSVTDLQLCIRAHENSEVQNGSDIGSRKKAPPNSVGLYMRKGWDFAQSHAYFVVFFSSFGPWITASDSHQSRRRSTVLPCSTSPMPGSQVFILVFDVQTPKCFAQPGDHHSCQASNTGSALKNRKDIIKKIPVVVDEVRKENAWWRSGVFKKSSRTLSKPKPLARTFGAKFYKSAVNKKLFEMSTAREKKRNNFELRTKIISWESLAQNIPEWPSPSHARNLVIHPWRIYSSHAATEMIILVTDISVIWHSTG